MKEQSQRYRRRACTAIKQGQYDSYYVMLVAPADYHQKHQTDAYTDYGHRIFYEELREYFDDQDSLRAAYKASVIDFASREKKTGYEVKEVKTITEFWVKLRKFCHKNHPKLAMLGEDAPKGAAARWPEFGTPLGNIEVVYKSQKGYIDLEFPGYGGCFRSWKIRWLILCILRKQENRQVYEWLIAGGKLTFLKTLMNAGL